MTSIAQENIKFSDLRDRYNAMEELVFLLQDQ